MKINLYTFNPYFCANTMKFRKDYSKRINEGNLTEQNIANLKGLADKFTDQNLTYAQCLQASKRHPYLLVQKPETLEYNIKETVKRFKNEGLTTQKYLRTALYYPNLFSCSPDTIEKNIRTTVKLFENYGLTTEKYLQCAANNATLYVTKPSTIKKKIITIAEKLNIPTSDILDMFMKQPTMLSMNEKELIKKFGLLKYIEENKFLDGIAIRPDKKEFTQSILRKKFTYSKEYFYTYLLRNKISAQLEHGHKLPHIGVIDSVINFIKDNKNNIINLTIPDGQYAKEFKAFVKNLSKQAVEKNIFKVIIKN